MTKSNQKICCTSKGKLSTALLVISRILSFVFDFHTSSSVQKLWPPLSSLPCSSFWFFSVSIFIHASKENLSFSSCNCNKVIVLFHQFPFMIKFLHILYILIRLSSSLISTNSFISSFFVVVLFRRIGWICLYYLFHFWQVFLPHIYIGTRII